MTNFTLRFLSLGGVKGEATCHLFTCEVLFFTPFTPWKMMCLTLHLIFREEAVCNLFSLKGDGNLSQTEFPRCAVAACSFSSLA